MKPFRTHFGGFGNRLFQLAYIYAQARKGEIPDIYVQDEKYFKEYAGELKQLYAEGLEKIDMVSLHVRRGDYIDNPFYVDLCETNYYERAMELFPDEKFLVFCTDRQDPEKDERDMEWCKEKFKGREFEFFRGKDELEDWNTQASCKAHIIPNSSFSWWAAYVGGGKTVAPKEYYTNGKEGIKPAEGWIVI